jgi:hypothetical protein
MPQNAAPATSLVPVETTAQPAISQRLCIECHATTDPAVSFRHSGWHRSRTAARAGLVLAGARPAQLAAWDNCGSGAWVFHDQADPSRLMVRGSCCKNRLCLPCAQNRGNRIAAHLAELIGGKPCRFITLTLRSEPHVALSTRLDRLYNAFRALRRQAIWRRAVDGGAAFLEVTRTQDHSWHVHLHCVVVGRYIHQATLASTWLAITGDSFVVDVRLVRSAEQTCSYVAKYCGKPPIAACGDDPALLADLAAGLKGRRLCAAFGTWRTVPLTEYESGIVWIPVCSLRSLLRRAAGGDADALQTLAALRYIRWMPAPSMSPGHRAERPPPPSARGATSD